MDKIQLEIHRVISVELDCLKELPPSIDDNYTKVVQLLHKNKGKVIWVGMGKSGHIAQKIASTMSSTGTPSCFLHPAEACHGDLGIVSSEDIVIFISKSGESEEIANLTLSLKKIKIPLIAICSQKNSTLAKQVDYLLYLPVKKEACSINLAPTSSTTLALVIGDALAMALMDLKGFTKEHFAKFHPAGSLGKKLLLQVEDVMKKGIENPTVHINETFTKVIIAITKGKSNAVSVTNDKKELVGLITGYDIRGLFQNKRDFSQITAKQIMNKNPITFPAKSNAYDALLFMKQNKKSFNTMPIVDGNKPIGMLSLQDLVRSGL